MPSINMIAARRAEKKKLEQRVRAAFLVIIAGVALGLGVLSYMAARVYTAGQHSESLDQTLSRFQPKVDMIRDYESQISALAPRLELLSQSKGETLLWCSVLQDLSQSMPEKTWLMNITTQRTQTTPAAGKTASAGATVVSLKGVSVSQKLVGEAMLRLNRFPEFQRVDLTYTQQGTKMAADTLDFEVAAMLNEKAAQKGGSSDAPHS